MKNVYPLYLEAEETFHTFNNRFKSLKNSVDKLALEINYTERKRSRNKMRS